MGRSWFNTWKSYTPKFNKTLLTAIMQQLTFYSFLALDGGRRWSRLSLVLEIPRSLRPSSHRPWRQSVEKCQPHSSPHWIQSFGLHVFHTHLNVVFNEGLRVKQSLKQNLTSRHRHLKYSENNNTLKKRHFHTFKTNKVIHAKNSTQNTWSRHRSSRAWRQRPTVSTYRLIVS